MYRRPGGEVLAAALPGTNVFKAFNTVGAEQLGSGDGSNINGTQLSMLMAGGPEVRTELRCPQGRGGLGVQQPKEHEHLNHRLAIYP